MADFFKRDGILQGIILATGSEILAAALLYVGLLVAGIPVETRLRWFAVCFVAPLLLLRHIAKRKDRTLTMKTIIVILFVSFVAFMFLLLKTKALEL